MDNSQSVSNGNWQSGASIFEPPSVEPKVFLEQPRSQTPVVDELFNCDPNSDNELDDWAPLDMSPRARAARLVEDRHPFDKQAMTAANSQSLLQSLNMATIRLEGAIFRIGYLEAQVESLQDQLKVVPELRTRAAQGILSDRENSHLKEKVSELEIQNNKNSKIVDQVNNSILGRLTCWALGIDLNPAKSETAETDD